MRTFTTVESTPTKEGHEKFSSETTFLVVLRLWISEINFQITSDRAFLPVLLIQNSVHSVHNYPHSKNSNSWISTLEAEGSIVPGLIFDCYKAPSNPIFVFVFRSLSDVSFQILLLTQSNKSFSDGQCFDSTSNILKISCFIRLVIFLVLFMLHLLER